MRYVLFGRVPSSVALQLRWSQVGPAARGPIEHAGLGDGSANVHHVDSRSVWRLWALVHELLPLYTEKVAVALVRLREAFALTSSASRFAWEDVRHLLLIGWFMDLRVTAELGGIPLSESDWAAIAFEAYPREGCDCGVRIQQDSTTVFGELWLDGTRRWPSLPVNLGREGLRLLSTVARGLDSEQPEDAKTLRELAFFGLIQTVDSRRAVLAIPVFDQRDLQLLTGALVSVGRDTARVIRAHIGSQGQLDRDCWRLIAFLRLLLIRGCRQVLDEGLLPRPPSDGRSWGLWLELHDRPSPPAAQIVSA